MKQNQQISNYIEAELKLLKNEVLKVLPKTKIAEIEKLFSDKISIIFDALTKKSYYIRDQRGRVASYDTIDDAADSLKIKAKTLACYMSNKSFTEVKGFTVSKIPLVEKEINNPNYDPDTIWIRTPDGKVQTVKTIEKAAKILKLLPKTLYCMLSSGKGITLNKNGIASRTPLDELTYIESFQISFAHKHGRPPYDHELPTDRTGRY